MKKNCWGYHHFTHVYRKPQSYEVQFLRYKVTQIFVVILGHFFGLLPPLTTQITKILKKWKNPLDISSFYTSVPQMTVMWYMVPEISTATEFFHHLWPFFAVLPPPPLSLTARKKKISKKLKRHLEISSFYTSAPKFMIISYTVPKIWHVTHKFFFIFEYFLLFYTPNSLKKQNFKKWNKHLERSSFYMCTKNYD